MSTIDIYIMEEERWRSIETNISMRGEDQGSGLRAVHGKFKYNLKSPYMYVHMELIFYQLCELN